MDRTTMKYAQDQIRERLKGQLLGVGPMNIEQVQEIVRKEIAGTLAGLVPEATIGDVKCDRQGRITLTVKLPDWVVKLYDINNPKSYESVDPVEPADMTAEQMMAEGEVGEEIDGHAS